MKAWGRGAPLDWGGVRADLLEEVETSEISILSTN